MNRVQLTASMRATRRYAGQMPLGTETERRGAEGQISPHALHTSFPPELSSIFSSQQPDFDFNSLNFASSSSTIPPRSLQVNQSGVRDEPQYAPPPLTFNIDPTLSPQDVTAWSDAGADEPVRLGGIAEPLASMRLIADHASAVVGSGRKR